MFAITQTFNSLFSRLIITKFVKEIIPRDSYLFIRVVYVNLLCAHLIHYTINISFYNKQIKALRLPNRSTIFAGRSTRPKLTNLVLANFS